MSQPITAQKQWIYRTRACLCSISLPILLCFPIFPGGESVDHWPYLPETLGQKAQDFRVSSVLKAGNRRSKSNVLSRCMYGAGCESKESEDCTAQQSALLMWSFDHHNLLEYPTTYESRLI